MKSLLELFPNASRDTIALNGRKPRKDRGAKRPRDFNTCLTCGKVFHAPHSFNRKFCSLICAWPSPVRNAPMKQKLTKDRGERSCKRCGKTFRVHTSAPKSQHCSHLCSLPPRKHSRSGWRTVGGQRFWARSGWEANYARYLELLKQNGEIQSWEYEPKTFWFEKIKRGVRSYTPDFLIKRNDQDEYHELKGWMDARSKTKIKRMKKYHPLVSLIVVDSNAYRNLSRQLKHIIKDWE